jgi:hypothetical protein
MKRMPQPTVVLDYPFHGRWLARNSPARRVPSHGTHLFGTTYAIDFVGVDERGRSAARTWRTLFSVEQPELFVGFGRPVLAPVGGRVVAVHDAEPDHVARRSQLALLPYALRQRERVRAGGAAIAGNHVVIALGLTGPFVLLAHLLHGSVLVRPGDDVESGNRIRQLRQLRQQHPTARARPGHRLARLAALREGCRWRLPRQTAPSGFRVSPRSWSSTSGDRSAPTGGVLAAVSRRRRRPLGRRRRTTLCARRHATHFGCAGQRPTNCSMWTWPNRWMTCQGMG